MYISLVSTAQLYYNALCKKNVNILNVIFVEFKEIRDLLLLQNYMEKLKYLMFLGSGRK